MTHEANDLSLEGERVNAIIANYLRAADNGAAPSRQELLDRHPDLATELQAFFADHDELNQMAQPLREGLVETPRPAESLQIPAKSSAADAPTLAPGESVAADPDRRVRYFGDYELLDEIARGGMGIVYKARQSNLNRVVALKMILAGQFASPADVQRFHAEAQAAANLDHPNIVPIYEVGEHEGHHYFSMRLVEGGSLAQWLGEHRASLADLPDAGAQRNLQMDGAELIAAVARGIHHAHQRGVLHRDLKPANILLQAPQSTICNLKSTIPLVTDFGLAKRVEGESNLTRSGAIVGTPSYMAPEQASGKKGLTIAVDVYSLGAILYELLTGRPPFRAETALDTVLQVLEQEPVRPRQLNPRVDHDLETICLKCLEKDPRRRYASAEDLALDLERWRAGEPIVARRAGPWERTLKWARRRPAAAGLLTVSAVSLVCLLALAGFLWHNAELRAEAVQNLEVANRDVQAALEQQETAKQETAKQQQLVQEKRTEVQRLEGLAQLERQKASAAEETARRLLYAADMQFANAAWATDNMQRMIPLLERHRQVGAPTDPRGFEWHYLWRLSHGERFTLQAHTEPQKRFAAGAAPPAEHEFAKNPVLLALAPDGKTLASTSLDNKIKLWDITTGKELRVLPGPGPAAVSLAFGVDGKSLILVTAKSAKPGQKFDPTLLMEALTGKARPSLDSFTRAFDARVLNLDGKMLAAPAKLNPARLAAPVNLFAGGQESMSGMINGFIPLQGRIFSPMCLVAAPDRKTLAVGGIVTEIPKIGAGPFAPEQFAPKQNGAILLWDLAKGEELALLQGHSSIVLGLAFAPNGETLASSSFDKTVKIWRLDRQMDGKLLAHETATLTDHSTFIPALAFSADGKTLVSGAADGNVKLWDVASKQVRLQCKGHLQGVMSVVMTPDSKTLLTGSVDGLLKVWDLNRVGGPFALPDQKTLKALAFSADGRTLTSVDQAGLVRLTDVDTGKENASFNLKTNTRLNQISSAAISPDGQTVASSGRLEDWVKLYDTRTGLERHALKVDRLSTYAMAFTADGKTLAVGKTWAVIICDVATGKEKETLAGHSNQVTCVAFSPDGTTLASGSTDQTVKLWDVATGRERCTLKGLRHKVACLAFAPDGLRLVAAAGDTIKMWDVATGQESLTINSYGHEPATMAFSPDGTRLVTGGKEGELAKGGGVKLWDARTGYELLTLGGASDVISCVAFSPDGRRLATAVTSGVSLIPLGQESAHVMIWDATPLDR